MILNIAHENFPPIILFEGRKYFRFDFVNGDSRLKIMISE